jgi:hypothetical protein
MSECNVFPPPHGPVHDLKPVPTTTQLHPWVICRCGSSFRTGRCPTCQPTIRLIPMCHAA